MEAIKAGTGRAGRRERRNGIFCRRSRQRAEGKRAAEETAGWQNGILQSLQKGSMVMAEGKATAEGSWRCHTSSGTEATTAERNVVEGK